MLSAKAKPPTLPAAESELTPAQQLAIAAIVSGKSYTEAAEAAGVDRRTLFEWRQLSGFAAALRDELQALRDAAGARLLGLADKAIDALAAVMAGDNPPAMVSAARDVLDRLGIDGDASRSLFSGDATKAATGSPGGPRYYGLLDSDKAVELLRQRRMHEMKENERKVVG
jgi:hypothetical protein